MTSLREMGRESFTEILGAVVPWEGYITLGGERIWIRIDHGQIVAAHRTEWADGQWVAEWVARGRSKP